MKLERITERVWYYPMEEDLFDDIAIDNPAKEMFLRHGFTEEARTEQVILLKKVL